MGRLRKAHNLTHQRHLFHFGKITHLYSIEINTRWQHASVKVDLVGAGLFLLVYQPRHMAAAQVKDVELHVASLFNVETNPRFGVEKRILVSGLNGFG